MVNKIFNDIGISISHFLGSTKDRISNCTLLKVVQSAFIQIKELFSKGNPTLNNHTVKANNPSESNADSNPLVNSSWISHLPLQTKKEPIFTQNDPDFLKKLGFFLD